MFGCQGDRLGGKETNFDTATHKIIQYKLESMFYNKHKYFNLFHKRRK